MIPEDIYDISQPAKEHLDDLNMLNVTCGRIYFQTFIIILGRNGIFFTWVAASYRGEARGLSINASHGSVP